MTKMNKHIEIVSSRNPRLSSMSDESRQALQSALSSRYSHVVITLIDNPADLATLVTRRPDLVFLGLKYIPQSGLPGSLAQGKIWLGQYLQEHGINFTGSDHVAHRLELNKPFAKQRILASGLKTSAYMVARRSQPVELEPGLAYPLFVKPTNRGGGLGIDSDSVVHNLDGLKAKVADIALNNQSDSLVEQYLPGREFSVAILGNEAADDLMIMPIELDVEPDSQGARILSNRVKSSNREVATVVMAGEVRANVCQLAVDVFRALGARDYGRIDIRLDETGVPHFLEANLLPSLISGYGSFPKACLLNEGLGYEAMVLTIVRLAMARTTGVPEETFPHPAVPALAT